jgi:hypothetical protein
MGVSASLGSAAMAHPGSIPGYQLAPGGPKGNIMTTSRQYAIDCIPEITPVGDILADGETADEVAEAMLENWPPEADLDPDECRQALIDRIEELMNTDLLVATLQGGDIEGDYNHQAVWLDLEGANGKWRALVASAADAEDLAENTGAELVATESWDGAPFGDGNAGTVACRAENVLLADHPEFVTPPDGWTVAEEEELTR